MKTPPILKHLFASYEQALQLKQLGFGEPCFCFYSSSANAGDNDFSQLWWPTVLDKDFNNNTVEAYQLSYPQSCLAPTFQQAIDFLDEKYSISIGVVPTIDSQIKFYEWIIRTQVIPKVILDGARYRSHKEATIAAIEEALNIIFQNTKTKYDTQV